MRRESRRRAGPRSRSRRGRRRRTHGHLDSRAVGRDWLFEIVPKGSVCAEIGVWQGEFSEKILSNVAPADLHLIDPWRYVADDRYERARYGGKAGGQAEMDAAYEHVVRRFARPIARGIVTLHRKTSERAALMFADAYFDWVYVDGNHLYEFVRQDLELFEPKVKPGGLIAGDDYGRTGWWDDGVTRAVDEFVAARGCQVVGIDNHQFVLRKRSVRHSPSVADDAA